MSLQRQDVQLALIVAFAAACGFLVERLLRRHHGLPT